MANEQQLERWAQALVEAAVVGDLAACEKFNASDRTLRDWRQRLKTTPRLRQLYEEKMSRVPAEFSDSLTTRSAVVAVRRQGPDRRVGSVRGPTAARRFADAAAAEVVAVAAACGLPEVKSAERNHYLPSGHIVRLLISHRDGSYSVCEVLTEASASDQPRVLGHLLFCFEALRMHYRVPGSAIRLCVLTDHDAPPLWNRVLANIKVEVGFYNIVKVVRARLLGQEVSPDEPVKPPRRRTRSGSGGGYKCCRTNGEYAAGSQSNHERR